MTAATDVGPGERLAPLDGVRALAILLVLIHNAGSVSGPAGGVALKLWTVVSNAGWIGVQLFFALSGFLITGILLRSRNGDGWLRSFYARRVLRIVPLYFLLLAIVFFVAPHVGWLEPIGRHGTRSQWWYWTYLSNWAAPFGNMAAGLPHVWSLAVEEQFYLVWPLLVGLASEGALAAAAAAMFVGAIMVRIALHAAFPFELASAAAYTWTITRSDAIGLGALVAIAMRHPNGQAFLRRRWSALTGAALGALAIAMLLGRGLSSEGTIADLLGVPMSGALSAMIVAACVLPRGDAGWSARTRGALVRVLSARWLTTIGKYSYAIYVFHLPVHLLLRPHVLPYLENGGTARRLAAYILYTSAVLGISMALALVSWRALEQPLLSLKRRFPMPAARSAELVAAD